MDRRPGKGRGRNRRDDRRGGRRPPPGRRAPPPGYTGLEARFFENLMRSHRRLVLVLADGRTVRGTIQTFDRDQVTIADATGPIMIRKAEIRYLYEDS